MVLPGFEACGKIGASYEAVDCQAGDSSDPPAVAGFVRREAMRRRATEKPAASGHRWLTDGVSGGTDAAASPGGGGRTLCAAWRAARPRWPACSLREWAGRHARADRPGPLRSRDASHRSTRVPVHRARVQAGQAHSACRTGGAQGASRRHRYAWLETPTGRPGRPGDAPPPIDAQWQPARRPRPMSSSGHWRPCTCSSPSWTVMVEASARTQHTRCGPDQVAPGVPDTGPPHRPVRFQMALHPLADRCSVGQRDGSARYQRRIRSARMPLVAPMPSRVGRQSPHSQHRRVTVPAGPRTCMWTDWTLSPRSSTVSQIAQLPAWYVRSRTGSIGYPIYACGVARPAISADGRGAVDHRTSRVAFRLGPPLA